MCPTEKVNKSIKGGESIKTLCMESKYGLLSNSAGEGKAKFTQDETTLNPRQKEQYNSLPPE